MKTLNVQSVITFFASITVLIFYVFCIIQAVSKRTRIWKIAPYIIAMAPVTAHAYNYGPVFETFLAAITFIALTKLIVVLAEKEWGEPDE